MPNKGLKDFAQNEFEVKSFFFNFSRCVFNSNAVTPNSPLRHITFSTELF